MRCVVCVMSGWPRGAADSLRWLLRMCQRAPGGRSLFLSHPRPATATLATAKGKGGGRGRGEEGVTWLRRRGSMAMNPESEQAKMEKPAMVADGSAVRVLIEALDEPAQKKPGSRPLADEEVVD